MSKILLLFFLFPLLLTSSLAQGVRVNPTGVNVDSQGATTVFLTFGGLNNQRPAEACWCGELIPAAPGFGLKCNPATILGCLPDRYNLSTASGNSGLTDIMSIPPSVARRAYQAAEDGAESRFFYVRRFINTAGGLDEYVAVTCRLTGGGARVPFALTNVKLSFDSDKPILFLKRGQKVRPLRAEITYNGTGRLRGRWEVVMPGEELPSERDLMTEATLPVEERPLQRRYTQLSRFNLFLPPTGKYVLPGPDETRLPRAADGMYLVLLRIEATDDREGDSDLGAVGAGDGVVHSGAVAGFSLPTLRYFVGGKGTPPASQSTDEVTLLLPLDETTHPHDKPLDFRWTEFAGPMFYRVELEDSQSRPVLSAVLQPGVGTYRGPSWLREKLRGGSLRWRVVALDRDGNQLSESSWRRLRLTGVR